MTKRLLDDYSKLSEYLIQPIFSDYKERDWKYIIHKYIDVPRFVIWMNVVEKIAECLEQWVQMHGIQNSIRSSSKFGYHWYWKFRARPWLLDFEFQRGYAFQIHNYIFPVFIKCFCEFCCSSTIIDWYYQILSK